MSNYFNFVDRLTPGTKARADEVNALLDQVSAGFDALPPTTTAIVKGTPTLGIESGSGNSYFVTLTPARASNTEGDEVVFKATHSNTGPATLQLAPGPVVSLRGFDGAVLNSGDIVSGLYYTARYDGTVPRFVLNNSTAASSAGSAAASAVAAAASAAAAATSATNAGVSATAAAASASAASTSAANAAASAASIVSSGAACSVLGRSVNSSGALAAIAAAADDLILTRAAGVLGFTQLTSGMFPNTVVPNAALSANVVLNNIANTLTQPLVLSPPAAAIGLRINGADGNYTADFVGPSTVGQSYGLRVLAGTNASDQSFLVRPQGGNPYLTIRGDGAFTFGNVSSSSSYTFLGSGDFITSKAILVGGSNAGLAGQVMTSAGAGAAPTWAYPATTAYKTADTARSSTTTLAADTHLTVFLAANATYSVEGVLLYTDGGAGGGLRLQFSTGPTGFTEEVGVVMIASGVLQIVKFQAATTQAITDVSTGVSQLPVNGVVINGSTPGTWALNWAQAASNATATQLKLGSWLRFTRLN